MGSYFNFKNFGDVPMVDGNVGCVPGDFALARQSSIFSLTIDELQNTWSGVGKDFGSMNMDELLKNIWTAEETQAMNSEGSGILASGPSGNLQRQGSLTLPRTISQKTVDEVWKDLLKENGGVKDGSTSGSAGPHVPQKQPTLGEMTLEEFLARAGVVREDMQPGRPSNCGSYGELSEPTNGNLTIEFQHPSRPSGLLGKHMTVTNNNPVSSQPPILGRNVGALRSSQPMHQQQQRPLFPKQSTVAFAPPMHLVNSAQLSSPGAKGGIGVVDPSMNNTVAQGGGISTIGLGTGVVPAGTPANHMQSDMIAKNNVDTSSVSPISCTFNQGRKRGSLEKVVERRQRRMIKNRESAARSRARKQAYTLELEAEIEKQKEINEELQRKLAEIMDMQKSQFVEKMNRQHGRGGKRLCLERTLTGPW